MMATAAIQVVTTLEQREEAERLGRQLVEQRLAACAQVVGPIRSIYWWQKQVEQAEEWQLHLKTLEARYPALEAAIREAHPYDVPEILCLPVIAGNPAYLDWMAAEVEPQSFA